MSRFNVKWALLGAVLALGGCGEDDDDIVPATGMDASVETDAAVDAAADAEMDAAVSSNGIAELLAEVDPNAATTTVQVFDPAMPITDVYVTAVAGKYVYMQGAKGGPALLVYDVDWTIAGLDDLAVGDVISFDVTQFSVFVPNGGIPSPQVTELTNLSRSMQGADISALRETLTDEDIVTNYGDYRFEMVSIPVLIVGESASQGGSATNYDAITLGHDGPTGLVVRTSDSLTAKSCYTADSLVTSFSSDVQLSVELTTTLLDNCPTGLEPPPDGPAPVAGSIADVRAAAVGALAQPLALSGAYVTYVIATATSIEMNVQTAMTGPALHIADYSFAAPDDGVDPTTIKVGDTVSFNVLATSTSGQDLRASSISGLAITASGFDVSTLRQDISAVDAPTNLADYENELVTVQARVTETFGPAGGGHNAADVVTEGAATGVVVRVNQAVVDQTTLNATYAPDSCVTVHGVINQYNGAVQVHPASAADITVLAPCPAAIALPAP